MSVTPPQIHTLSESGGLSAGVSAGHSGGAAQTFLVPQVSPSGPQHYYQDCPYLSNSERHSSAGSGPANGEENLPALANGKLDRLKTQRRTSCQRPEKVLHQFQLSMLHVSASGDNMVECQLETHSNKMVTFKFDVEGDAPEDIADCMVEEVFVLDVEKEKFVEELRAIVTKAQEILQTHSKTGSLAPLHISMPSSSSIDSVPHSSPVGRWRFFINQTIRHRDSLSSQGATTDTKVPLSPKTDKEVEGSLSQESVNQVSSPPSSASSPPVITVSAPVSAPVSIPISARVSAPVSGSAAALSVSTESASEPTSMLEAKVSVTGSAAPSPAMVQPLTRSAVLARAGTSISQPVAGPGVCDSVSPLPPLSASASQLNQQVSGTALPLPQLQQLLGGQLHLQPLQQTPHIPLTPELAPQFAPQLVHPELPQQQAPAVLQQVTRPDGPQQVPQQAVLSARQQLLQQVVGPASLLTDQNQVLPLSVSQQFLQPQPSFAAAAAPQQIPVPAPEAVLQPSQRPELDLLQKQSLLHKQQSESTEDASPPSSDSSVPALHLSAGDTPLPPISLNLSPSPAQPSSVAESDSEGPPKIEFVDNRIKTLDEKLRNLLYQEYSAGAAPASASTSASAPSTSEVGDESSETQAPTHPLSSSDTSPHSSSSTTSRSSSTTLDPEREEEAASLPLPSTSLSLPPQDAAVSPRPPVPGEPPIVDVSPRSDTGTATGALQPAAHQLIPLQPGPPQLNAGEGHHQNTHHHEEKASSPEAHAQTHEGRFQVTPVPSTSPPKVPPQGRRVGRFSVTKAETRRDERLAPHSSPASPDLLKDKRGSRLKEGEREEGKRSLALLHLPRGHTHSPPHSSDDEESELEDEDLRKELHKLREKHIKEVVSLQAQQNRELLELYRQLRSMKGQRQSLPAALCRTPPLTVALPILSPRRPRPPKVKLRPRPHSHLDNNGVTHSGLQQSSSFFGGEQSRLPAPHTAGPQGSASTQRDHSPAKRSTFTDELHKLVDDWTMESASSAPSKLSLNQIKLIQQVQESGGWSQLTEMFPAAAVAPPPTSAGATPTPSDLHTSVFSPAPGHAQALKQSSPGVPPPQVSDPQSPSSVSTACVTPVPPDGGAAAVPCSSSSCSNAAIPASAKLPSASPSTLPLGQK